MFTDLKKKGFIFELEKGFLIFAGKVESLYLAYEKSLL